MFKKIRASFWYTQARGRALRFGGQNTFLGGQDFCFYYMFKTNFAGHNTIWGGTKIFGGALPPNAPPHGYGPGYTAVVHQRLVYCDNC